ncbi:MAG: glycosyltransferase [Patescibacteria group bacterium]
MKLAIGVITYNDSSIKYLPDFLGSLLEALNGLESVEWQILVRDNSEQENNPNKDYFNNLTSKDHISFIWSGANLGFAKAYNLMISDAKEWGADYFLMINPDIFIKPNAILEMLAAINNDQKIASVTPKILRWDFANKKFTNYIDSCGLSIGSGLVFRDIGQGRVDDGSFDKSSIIGASGAAALFRMSALEDIKDDNGYLDEEMFMYKEDCDLAYRLFLKGYKSILVPQAIIYHDRSVSAVSQGLIGSIKSRKDKNKLVKSWSFLNQHLLIIKHWHAQNFKSKILILLRLIPLWGYAIVFEPFLLKNCLIIKKKIAKK